MDEDFVKKWLMVGAWLQCQTAELNPCCENWESIYTTSLLLTFLMVKAGQSLHLLIQVVVRLNQMLFGPQVWSQCS